MLSSTTEYALRAVIWLASQRGQNLRTEAIAQATQVPASYLAKVLQTLSRAGIVQSQSGPRGGFQISFEPDRLTVLDVVNAIEPIERISECPLRLSEHRHELCTLHARLDAARAAVEQALGSCTIASLLEVPREQAPLCLQPSERPS